ncbi:Hypothetical predicted protein [Podarcis lilfordi]|uniref:Uncharacterized protein n=1 Tax=Podarcis lilfordi TaxID=74358 RepID=A0AA35KI14_9SAUR|nr:Hypothetical predicted protein [Podarcis lilfordi]
MEIQRKTQIHQMPKKASHYLKHQRCYFSCGLLDTLCPKPYSTQTPLDRVFSTFKQFLNKVLLFQECNCLLECHVLVGLVLFWAPRDPSFFAWKLPSIRLLLRAPHCNPVDTICTSFVKERLEDELQCVPPDIPC